MYWFQFIFGCTALGFNSIMTVCMNVIPKVVQTIRNAVKDGNINSARLTQKYLTSIMDSIFAQGLWSLTIINIIIKPGITVSLPAV